MGKIVIVKQKNDDNSFTLGVSKDFREMTLGEISAFIAELELAKLQLIKKFEQESD